MLEEDLDIAAENERNKLNNRVEIILKDDRICLYDNEHFSNAFLDPKGFRTKQSENTIETWKAAKKYKVNRKKKKEEDVLANYAN